MCPGVARGRRANLPKTSASVSGSNRTSAAAPAALDMAERGAKVLLLPPPSSSSSLFFFFSENISLSLPVPVTWSAWTWLGKRGLDFLFILCDV